MLWQYFLSYASILKIKRIKRYMYHIKGIGSPLLILINIDQETEKSKEEKMIRLEPRLHTGSRL